MKAAAARRKQTPIEIAIRNAAITPQKALDELKMAELAALDSIARGFGALGDIQKLADVSNIAGVLCKVFKIGGKETALAIIEGEIALINCAARTERTGSVSFTSDELEAIREMVSWAHAQREVIDRKTFMKAMKLTIAQIRNNHNTIDLNNACSAINGNL